MRSASAAATRASDDYDRFSKLSFEGFRELANDDSLSKYEKIGFPDSYRAGKEEAIFADIRAKLTNLDSTGGTVLDIGPGCSDLPSFLVSFCRERRHRLLLADSRDMLRLLPDGPSIEKIPGFFPRDAEAFLREHRGRVDAILTYSVLHYVFAEGNLFEFLDAALDLLAHDGQMLIGDVPNISKRKRFFASPSGIRYHQEFTGTSQPPAINFSVLERGHIDDGVILGILQRYRGFGFDAFLLPQAPSLPMANRREDILIRKP